MVPMANPPDMSIDLAGVTLRNPVIAASGTSGYIDEFAHVLQPNLLGALVTKSISRAPWTGNPPWRIVDAREGMLNAIGLANVGLDRFLSEKLPKAASLDTVIIASICGNSIEEYVAVAEAFDAAPELPLVELNVSCPNTDDGLVFGEHPASLSQLVRAVREVLKQTKMIVKLSPNVGDVRPLAKAAIEAGADVLTLINTVSAMAIDVETRQPRLSRGTGGLSGPAIHPVAVRIVYEVYEDVARSANVPIIGLGGVMNWRDGAEMILAGATAVGMGTALFVDPRAPGKVVKGLRKWVERQEVKSVRELVGQVQV